MKSESRNWKTCAASTPYSIIMNIHPDFEECLQLFAAHQVEFVIVGGYAVAFYGYSRFTQDLDLFFRPSPENIRALMAALRDFGLSLDESQESAFSEPGAIIRIGVAPVMLELINAISGPSFEVVWANRQQGKFGQVIAPYISLPDLLANKRTAGRPKDLADADELGGNR